MFPVVRAGIVDRVRHTADDVRFEGTTFMVNIIRRTVTGAVLAASIAVPALFSAGTASAMPISTLRTECRGAGGAWQVEYMYSGAGIRYVSGYECWYRDIHGGQHVDFYDRRGNYGGSG